MVPSAAPTREVPLGGSEAAGPGVGVVSSRPATPPWEFKVQGEGLEGILTGFLRPRFHMTAGGPETNMGVGGAVGLGMTPAPSPGKPATGTGVLSAWSHLLLFSQKARDLNFSMNHCNL